MPRPGGWVVPVDLVADPADLTVFPEHGADADAVGNRPVQQVGRPRGEVASLVAQATSSGAVMTSSARKSSIQPRKVPNAPTPSRVAFMGAMIPVAATSAARLTSDRLGARSSTT